MPEWLGERARRRYFFRYLPWHLAEAGRRDELKALLGDYAWIAAKLRAADVQSMIADYEAWTSTDVRLH